MKNNQWYPNLTCKYNLSKTTINQSNNNWTCYNQDKERQANN